MPSLLERNLPLLEVLYLASPKTYQSLLVDKSFCDILSKLLVEIAHNLLFVEQPTLGEKEKAQLRKEIWKLRKLANNKSKKDLRSKLVFAQQHRAYIRQVLRQFLTHIQPSLIEQKFGKNAEILPSTSE